MEDILKQVETYTSEIVVFNTSDPETLESFRIRFLGMKGLVKSLMGEMKNIPADKKKNSARS